MYIDNRHRSIPGGPSRHASWSEARLKSLISAGMRGPGLQKVVCRAHDLGGTRSSPAKQVRQVSAAGLELAAGDRGVYGGHEAGGRLIKAGLLQRVGVLLGRQVTVGHLRTCDLADDPRELG